MLELDNPLWAFSTALWAAPGVAATCLALQEEAGADVNLLLLAAWMGAARGLDLRGEGVVAPLRAARRALPGGGDPALAGLRRRILDCELAAEQIQQARLHQWAAARGRGPARPGLARANLGALLPGGDSQALDRLAGAAEDLAGGA